jgi:hypothetical protein
VDWLGVISGAATNPRVIAAVRGILDFVYLSHFESHTDESLKRLHDAWATFHNNKSVWNDIGLKKDFNGIPKVHMMHHYVDSIRSRGAASGFNTEATERLCCSKRRNIPPKFARAPEIQKCFRNFADSEKDFCMSSEAPKFDKEVLFSDFRLEIDLNFGEVSDR